MTSGVTDCFAALIWLLFIVWELLCWQFDHCITEVYTISVKTSDWDKVKTLMLLLVQKQLAQQQKTSTIVTKTSKFRTKWLYSPGLWWSRCWSKIWNANIAQLSIVNWTGVNTIRWFKCLLICVLCLVNQLGAHWVRWMWRLATMERGGGSHHALRDGMKQSCLICQIKKKKS